MSSNLKVNTILPSTGSNIGIGTNGGELNVDGGCKVQVGTALTLGHSIGLQYATQNLHSTGFEINQINASGIITASHFYGNGANLSGITQTTINNNANNRLITGSGTANTLEGEANLTYDGTNLQLVTDANNEGIKITGGSYYPVFEMDANRSAGNTLGKLVQKWNGTQVASISFVSGSDGTNKDDGIMYFNTASSGTPLERLRITSSGALGTNSTVRSANGGLDLCSQGATNYGTLTLGAGGGQNGQSRSSNQENQFRIMMPTYANPANMTTVLYGTSGSNGHDLHYGGGTGWAYATNTHRFFTTANQTTGNGTERIRVHSGGTVNVPSGITLGQSVSSTAASNTLDDYEEGSWNPLWSNSASNSGGTTTSNNMYGKYTKIGRIVHAYFYTWGLPAGNSGSMYLQGFPFQCNGDPGSYFCAVQSAFYNFGADNYYNLGLRLSTNRTFAELIFCRKDSGNYVAANFSGFINYYTNFQGVMTYEVA